MFDKHKAEKAAAEHAVEVERLRAEAQRSHDLWQAAKLDGTMMASSEGLILKKGEVAYGSVKGAGLVEPRRLPGHWAGGSHGVSIHVAKGLNYRVGQSRGTFTQGAEVPTVIDTGLFTITNQRCVFVGPKRSVEWAYAKLLGFSLEAHATAIFNVSNRQKASGVTYPAQFEATCGTIIAAAIAQFQGDDNHRAFVAEMEGEYSSAWHAWNALQAEGPAALA